MPMDVVEAEAVAAVAAELEGAGQEGGGEDGDGGGPPEINFDADITPEEIQMMAAMGIPFVSAAVVGWVGGGGLQGRLGLVGFT
jgi:hypothetical protein